MRSLLIFFAVPVAAVFAPFALSLLLLSVYGVDLLPLFTRFEFSVEETPSGRHLVEQLAFARGTALQHSVAYEHPDCPRILQRWLTEREEGVRLNGRQQ
jgi:hypothetical protein